jgi:hypothetical protein
MGYFNGDFQATRISSLPFKGQVNGDDRVLIISNGILQVSTVAAITAILTNPSLSITFEAGANNPIIIPNWQVDYAELIGNRPRILITEHIGDDGDGYPAETERNDIRALRYYADSPVNAVLTSIKIDTGDGATLSNTYVIKFNL